MSGERGGEGDDGFCFAAFVEGGGRGMPKIAIRGNFTLGFEQPVKEKLPPKQCSAP